MPWMMRFEMVTRIWRLVDQRTGDRKERITAPPGIHRVTAPCQTVRPLLTLCVAAQVPRAADRPIPWRRGSQVQAPHPSTPASGSKWESEAGPHDRGLEHDGLVES